MRQASLVLASCCFLTFIVGSQVAFRRQRDTTRHLLLLTVAAPLSAVGEVLAIATASQPLGIRWSVGMTLFVGSLSLFLWTGYTTRSDKFTVAFSTDRPHVLVDRGPFALVRHPFYAAYLTAYVAGFVLTDNPWLVIVVVGMASLYGYAALVEERKFGRSDLCPDYDAYRAHTRMFIPLPRRQQAESGRGR